MSMSRWSSRISPALALATLALTAGCGGSKLQGHLIDGVLTHVEPVTIIAGGSARVSCELVGDDGYATVTTTFSVTPDGVVLINGDTVTTTVAGTYVIACAVPLLGVVDPIGATLTVAPGKPVSVRPVFDANPITAGGATGVHCASFDSYGNPSPIAGTPVGDAPLVFSGGTVGSDVAGSFPVTCDTPELPSLPREPATLIVTPGAVAGVELKIDPDRVSFNVGASANLYWVAVDALGNAIADAPGTLSAPTDPGLELVDATLHRYRFKAEGRYTFRVTLAPPLAPLSDDLTVTADSTAPVLVITFPERGATLAGDGAPVQVQGTVTDTWAGVGSFTINDAPVTVAADGHFTFPLPPAWGVNMIDARAADTGGNAVKLTPTFQYAPEYLPFVDSNAQGLKFDDGMVMLLGQDFLDDGVHDHADINDLATLFEVVLGDLDVEGQIDQALGQFEQTTPLADYTWNIGSVGVAWTEVTLHGQLDILLEAAESTAVGPTRVDIDSRTGGLDLDVHLGDAALPAVNIDLAFSANAHFTLTAKLCTFFGCSLALNTTVFGDATLTSGASIGGINLTVHTNIAKSPGAPLAIAFSDFDFSFDTLRIEPIQDVVLSLGVVDLPGVGSQTLVFPLSNFIDLNALIGGFLNPLSDLITTLVPPLLNPLVEGLAGPLLAGLFDAFSIDTTLPLPELLGERPETYELDFHTDLSRVAFTDPGGTVGLAAGFYADKGVDREPLGAILRAGCLDGQSDTLTWGWDPSIGIGFQTDMINAALFGAWWTGYLNGPLNVGALTGGGGGLPIPIDNLALNLRWLLPPTLDTCGGDGLGLQIGDLFVELTGTALGSPVRVTLYADLGFAASFVTDAGGLSLRIGELTFSDFEVLTSDAGALGDAFDLRGLVEDALPGLLGSFLVGQDFGPFSLPSTDLSATVPGLPPGLVIGLKNLSVSDQDGYVVIGGDMGPAAAP